MIVLHKSIHTSPAKLDFWSPYNGLYTCSPPAFAVNVALLTFLAEILLSWKPSSNAYSLMWPSLFLPGSCAHSLFTNLPPALVVSVLVSAALDCYSQGQWSPPPPSMFTPYLLIKKQVLVSTGYQSLCTEASRSTENAPAELHAAGMGPVLAGGVTGERLSCTDDCCSLCSSSSLWNHICQNPCLKGVSNSYKAEFLLPKWSKEPRQLNKTAYGLFRKKYLPLKLLCHFGFYSRIVQSTIICII